MSKTEKTARPNMIVGVFSSLPQAHDAVTRLESVGLNSQDITVISSNEVVKNFFEEYRPDAEPDEWKGAALLGGSAGALFGGLAATTAVITGAGIPLVAAGGLAGLLTGGIVGGLTGAMTERGFETEAADYYQHAVAEGKTLLAVDFTDRKDLDAKRGEIAEALEAAGSEPVGLSKNPDFASK